MGRAGRQKASHLLQYLLLFWERGTGVSGVRAVCEAGVIGKEECQRGSKARGREQHLVCKVCMKEKAKP